MAKQWSATSFAAIALICCLAGKDVEAQYKPQNPQVQANPQNPQVLPKPPYPQVQPNPQNPLTSKLSYDQAVRTPQNPQAQANPQNPYNVSPPQPQNPLNTKLSYDQAVRTLPYPQVQPKPQNPYNVSPPQPQNPLNTKLSYDQAVRTPAYPQVQPKPPYPQVQPKPPYPQVQPNPQNPYNVSPPQPQNPLNTKLSYDQAVKNPQNPQVHYDQSYQTPQISSQKRYQQNPVIIPVKTCDVERNVRVPCGVPGISATECEAIDCCHDGQQCFFGRTVTVQCTKEAYFIVVVARDVTLPNIDLETISLLGDGQGCSHVDSNSAFAIYYFPVTACGSVVMEEPGVIIYENRMTSSYEVGVGHLGAITRDSNYELLFQCRYIGTSVETLVVEVLPLDNPPLPVASLGPIRVHMRLANGECRSKGCNEVDAAYTSYYMDTDYPVTKVLRDPVYVEVQLLEKADPSLVLTLDRCWATTSPNAFSLPQWDILIDGCPYTDDRYLSSLVQIDPSSGLEFPSHYRRFIFKMFTFVDPNSMEPLKEQVFIHCSTAVCVAGQGVNCEPQCFKKVKRDTESADQRMVEPKIVVSSREVTMIAPEQ